MIDLEKEMARAYEQGWLEAAEWANRGDLAHDTESPAYIAAREKRLTGIRALFAGKVLCDAEPLMWTSCDNDGIYCIPVFNAEAEYRKSRGVPMIALYAAAKEQ